VRVTEHTLLALGAVALKDVLRFVDCFTKPLFGCWEWQGSCRPDGYGEFRLRRRTLRAHRVSWRLFNGLIPRRRCVLHRCDNRKCVRPTHLFLGTRADNMLDKMQKGRFLHDETHPTAKLHPKVVQAIRNEKGLSQRAIGEKYGADQSWISRIRNRKARVHCA
jgi:hypothetical protein